ncbi:MAG: efflux RND transporter permease subunit [Candidatus Eisenbacteria bacterium]
MTLSDLAVRRPVATTMLVLLGVLLGSVSLARLEVTLFPDLSAREVRVWIGYPDAGVDEIEEDIARPVESVLVGITGSERVSSEIVPGGVEITVRLRPGTDAEIAALAVRERLDAIRWDLPDGAERPVLAEGIGDRPAMVLALGAEDRVLAAEWARSVLRPRLEQLSGVARVQVVGSPEPEIRVEPIAERMRALGVTVEDLESALRKAAVRAEGGKLRRRGIQYAVEFGGGLETGEDVARTVLRAGVRPLRVEDVACVTEGFAPDLGWSRLDGSPAVGALVYRAAGANLLETTAEVREELSRLEEEDADVRTLVLQDPAPFVEQSVKGVWQAVLLGGALAFLVLIYFLGDLRAALVLGAALPASVLTGFLVFELLGLSLNLMSLGGVALGVGMLVDNGIVCLESIDRLRRLGRSAKRAAAEGANEIAGAVTSSTLTTCAVFLPMAAVPGPVGGLLRDQAVAITVSLTLSLLVALTFVPAMAARIPARGLSSNSPTRLPGFTQYHALLSWVVRHPGASLGALMLALLLSGVVFSRLPREILPELATDQLQLELELPPGHDVDSTDLAAREVEAWLRGNPAVEHVLCSVGAAGELVLSPHRRLHRAVFFVRLAGASVDRSDLARSLVDAFADRADWTLTVLESRPEIESILPSGDASLACEITAEDAADAESAAARLLAVVATGPGGDRFRIGSEEPAPRLGLRARGDAASWLGVTEGEIRQSLRAEVGGEELASARRFDRDVPVVLRPDGGAMPGAGPITLGGRVVPGRAVARAGIGLEASRILRVDQSRVARVVWNGPMREVAVAKASLLAAVERLDLPRGGQARLAGSQLELQATLRALGRSLLLSAGLVLLILAAQFESLRLPWLVLLSVPLAACGVAAGLVSTGASLNAMSGVGLVVLIGIVVNDAILEVDLLRRAGETRFGKLRAAIEAGKRRYRPILMTTATTTLALLPVYLGTGSELRAPLATVVIGGLTSSTLLTLLFVPLVFFLTSRIGARAAR